MATDVTSIRREDVRPIPAKAVSVLKRFMHVMTRVHVWIHTVSKGRIGKTFAGAPCCMVIMTGRKTGKKRSIPLIYIPHGEEVILIASQGGMDIHPVWYRNLLSEPNVEIIAEGRTRKMIARQANDAEKAARWPVALAVYADFDQYQARTDRDIPLMICTPA
ncbi:MAG: nitroreductase family deazaflavin-dependent oxidoreductase [Myxococcales bacterium]|nr:MAG: nitroreductase family deazaflavin-dependent oxidoreductase [Myxococcales bacterium]